MMVLFGVWAVCIMGAVIVYSIKDNKSRRQALNRIATSTYELDDWMLKTRHTILTRYDEHQLSLRLDFEQGGDTIPKNSLLDYLINKRPGNLRKSCETQKEFVVRLMKTDFERTHGMSFDKFMEVCKDIHENNPEMII